ncbi:glycosyltransferase family 2 protein [bacterium]|nr:glycosyltransferase family 2 protein [bacterium]
MAKVSIVTASYNYENYIKETIESVLAQTFQDWEMIIVDDGSTDNSVNVIKEYCKRDSRIKLYNHENGMNRGLSATLQLGILKATSDWIAFLESDDTISPDYLERKLDIIEKYPSIHFIFNDVKMFGDKRIIKKYNKHFLKSHFMLSTVKFPAQIPHLLKDINVIPTFSVVMLYKNILNDVNWESPIPKSLDHFLWSQLASKYNFYYLNKKLTSWRMNKNSYINRDKVSGFTILLFKLRLRQYLNNNFLVYDDFKDILQITEKSIKKYEKYKILYKVFYIISIFELFIVIILFRILFL